MVIFFFGIERPDIAKFMPTLVRSLGIGHEKYSALSLPPTDLFDEDGNHSGEGAAIGIPGFEHLRKNPGVLEELSGMLDNIPVYMVNAPVDGWINGGEMV